MTTGIGSIFEMVQRDIVDLTTAELTTNSMRLTTQVLYPSNGMVRVSLRLQNGKVSASDDGGAVYEAQSAGAFLGGSARSLKHIVAPHGLTFADMAIVSPFVTPESALGVAVLVANASSEAAHWMYANAKVRPSHNFRQLLADLLLSKYENMVSPNARIIGASSKAHTFPHLVKIRGDRSLLIDPVSNDPSSINARVVANLDVRSANNAGIEQRIVYDDNIPWEAANLNLLEVGAKIVPFSKLDSVIQRLVA